MKILKTSFVTWPFSLLFIFLISIQCAYAPLAHATDSTLAKNSVRSVPTGWMRRIVVFPFSGPQELKSELDTAWLKVRETLTQPRRFLIASRKFLNDKDSFLPRRTLNPADVVLLGKLLDTDVLMTGEIADRKVTLYAYSAADGLVFWQNEFDLKSSAPLRAQLDMAFTRLIYDFLSRVPYQGFITLDPNKGGIEYQEGDVHLMKAEVGTSALLPGDVVQWIRVERTSTEPLFQDGGRITVIADGTVVSMSGSVATVELKRRKPGVVISEGELVTFPRIRDDLESTRLSRHQDVTSNGVPEWVQAEIKPRDTALPKSKSLVTALIAIGNAVAILLLAM